MFTIIQQFIQSTLQHISVISIKNLPTCFGSLSHPETNFSNHSTGRVQLKCDDTRRRTGRQVKGKLANAVGSQYPSHYLGTRCIQHYYRWCRTPRLPAVDWTDAPPTGRFKWTGPFRAKDEIWFLRVWRHVSTGLNIQRVRTLGDPIMSTDYLYNTYKAKQYKL